MNPLTCSPAWAVPSLPADQGEGADLTYLYFTLLCSILAQDRVTDVAGDGKAAKNLVLNPLIGDNVILKMKFVCA